MNRKYWTEEEDLFLTNNYPQQTARECAANLNRSLDSTKQRLSKLKLSSSYGKLKTHEQYCQELFDKEINFNPVEPYVNNRTPITHECIEGHEFKVRPDNILAGRGCPSCSKTACFDPNKESIVYYIKIEHEQLIYYKIGVSNNPNVLERFAYDKEKLITIISIQHYATGTEALKAEKELFTQFKACRVSVPEFLKSNGNTELFEFDVLGLDRQK